MKENKSISAPIMGMNRDSNIEALQKNEYVVALNANIESTRGGNGYRITNEPSNVLSIAFPRGYVCISEPIIDNVDGRTYYFLTDDTTKKSIIGYTEYTNESIENIDSFQACPADCKDGYNIMQNGLESITQTPQSQFYEIINDECLPIGEGFNFDVRFPILSPVIRHEKASVKIYFNDYRNPPRWIDVKDVSYLFKIDTPCVDSVQGSCMQPYKLLQFPNHKVMRITPKALTTGGNIKNGNYEFSGVYCDLQGTEMTNYSPTTNPINVFDRNNVILEQNEIDSLTNFAIELEVDNLDTTFKYYKVVCIETNTVSRIPATFELGIFPTSTKVVTMTSSQNTKDGGQNSGNVADVKRVEDIGKKYKTFPIKAFGETLSDGKKFMYGLEYREELNLQPAVNIIGSLLKWQTSQTTEDLYKSAIATSLYKGYARDEQQPFGIRLRNTSGEYTATFPFIARPSVAGERDIIAKEDDANKNSLNDASAACIRVSRGEKWQIHNTASVDTGYCTTQEVGVEVEETIERSCIKENVFTIARNKTRIAIEKPFSTLKAYINDNYDEIIDPLSENYIADIASALTNPYSNIHCDNISALFPATGCSVPVLDRFNNVVASVVNDQHTYIESEFPEDYPRMPFPKYSNLYVAGSDNGAQIDAEFVSAYMACGERVYKRDFKFTNITQKTAEEITNVTDIKSFTTSYFTNYYGAPNLSGLLSTTINATPDVPNGFYNKLHIDALWFKLIAGTRKKFILEISRRKDIVPADHLFAGEGIRIGIYATKTATTPLKTIFVNTLNGVMIRVDRSTVGQYNINVDNGATETIITNSGTLYIAMDSKIVTAAGAQGLTIVNSGFPLFQDEVQCISQHTGQMRTAPVPEAVSIITRDIEFSYADIAWDAITLDKVETYTSTCRYNLPKINSCKPTAYQKGEFAFWESTKTYPDNKDLYDSSELILTDVNLEDLSANDKIRFLEYYTDGKTNNNYNHKADILYGGISTNFRCKPIRHYKFPNNTVSPFMSDNNAAPFSDAIIYPLGVTLDSGAVRAMIKIAVTNNLITQKEANEIVSYEIMKGDNSFSKSIIACGLGYDMYEYTQNNEKILYANYPHNDLGNDILHYTDAEKTELIPHPFGGTGNNRFTFLSPDLALNRVVIPTEVVLSGYQVGKSKLKFTDVDEHPKWTILGARARDTADYLADAEVVLEILIKSSELLIQVDSWFVVGVGSNGTNAVGTLAKAAAIVTFGIGVAKSFFLNKGKYRYQWLKIFDELGTADNFASYGVSVGHHSNFIKNNDIQNTLRRISVGKHLRSGDFTTRDENDGASGKPFTINNFLRETSTFISTGKHNLNYNSTYTSYDNSKIAPQVGSRSVASENGCVSEAESTRNVGSPYFTLKNYVPDQFGLISDIRWLGLNYVRDLDAVTDCETIFGGTVVISRYTEKRKMPLFRKNLIKTADRLPFKYSNYKNIGYPRFFCDYKKSTSTDINGIPFPDIDSDYNFDCNRSQGSFYVTPPAKMYTAFFGITSFLVESEINCNFRYTSPNDLVGFYPVNTEIQEAKVPLTAESVFRYNATYSKTANFPHTKKLDIDYNKLLQRQYNKRDNLVIYSKPHTTEDTTVDAFLVNDALNRKEFETEYGKLLILRGIENNQILAIFENQQVVFNSVDQLAARLTDENKFLGNAGLFATRPVELISTTLGFGGTQNSEILRTPSGSFWVDAKRSKVLARQLSNTAVVGERTGYAVNVISEGKGVNIKSWLRENLPFKILKDIPNIDVNNKFNGIGIALGWDAKTNRLFITKRDYRLINKEQREQITIGEDRKIYIGGEIKLTDTNYFEDCSWTIAYKADSGSWISYYSFKPNFYVSYNENFKTVNPTITDNRTQSLWNHPLNPTSNQVFYGVLEPFTVEVPIVNQGVNKLLNSISLNVEANRWQNTWDNATRNDIGFNKAVIYNRNNNSGVLNLNLQKTLADIRNYPKTVNEEQNILFSTLDSKHTFNYFYNRVVNQNNNIPHWSWDRNMINKTINSKAVTFKSVKRTLERMKGDVFIAMLTNDKTSQYQISLNNLTDTETIYE